MEPRPDKRVSPVRRQGDPFLRAETPNSPRAPKANRPLVPIRTHLGASVKFFLPSSSRFRIPFPGGELKPFPGGPGARLVERGTVKEIAWFHVETGPKRDRQAAVTLLAVRAAEVLSAGKMQGGRAVPDRSRIARQGTSLAGVLRHVDVVGE